MDNPTQNLLLPRDVFVKTYIEPAMKRLADDVKAGRPLSDIDRKVLLSCGYDPDELIEFYRQQREISSPQQ